MKGTVANVCILVVLAFSFQACSDSENPLAPYEGERPLILLQVTQSAAPEIQWVGGRAAAIGVNRGTEAALDSTLIWVTTASADDIGSPVRIGTDTDDGLILSVGGTPSDSLPNGSAYTVWIATVESFDSGLAKSDPFAFTDTTVTLSYLLRGRSGGDPALGVEYTVVRDQTLLDDKYTIYWTPSEQAFRRIAIRKGTIGGFTDLVWHVVQPEGSPDALLPPQVIGVTPDGADEAQEWLGFEPSNYVLWMATSDWSGDSFGFRTPGYSFFQIFANNFE